MSAPVGHVADLPSKGLAVDVDDGFKPTYELTDRGRQVVEELRAALKEASELYLATDEDREGEVIMAPTPTPEAESARETNGVPRDHSRRHRSRSRKPLKSMSGLVDAAETRRILDRLYGYEVSPILWRKVNRGLSAGRAKPRSTHC